MNTRQFLATSLIGIALGLAPLGAALAQLQAGDPPGRVGRVAEMSGTVSFHAADVTQWGPASLNYPVTGGNSFWTEPRSHAAIDVGASRIYLDSSTELDVANVDDQSFVASLPTGAIYIRLAAGANGDQYEIDTPRGAVHIVQPGDYEIIAGDADHPTTVMAFQGSAQVVGPDVSARVDPQQAIYISGQNPASVNQGQAQTDDFIRFVQAEEQPYQNAGPAPQYLSPEMTGYRDLGRYGQWNQDPSYGQVWYPRVDASWAPYREGHWAYVRPWGWTWIDDAPWGFTPFHYGRWVQVRHHWAWWPGRVAERPVYAPALVSFFGGFGGLSIGISIGQSVGWIPLGPEEVYIPPYRHSDRYGRDVNIRYVRNETTIINVINNTTVINNYNNFHNRDGATVVDGATMTGSRPVAPEFHKIVPNGKLDQNRWASVKPMGGNPPIQPTNQTRGAEGYKPPVSPGPNLANGNGQNGPDKNKSGQNNLKTQNNGQPQGNGPAVVGGSNLPPLKPGKGQAGQGQNGQIQNGQNQNGNGQNNQTLKTQNNGQPQGNGPAVVGGSNLPPLKPGNGQTGQGQNGQIQNGQNQNGNGQNNQTLKTQNNGQPQGNGPAVVGGSNLPPLKPGNGQTGQGQNGQIQNGQNQNGNGQNNQTLKTQNNGQPQGNGPAVVGGSNLPPLKPGNGQTGQGQNGQIQNGQNQNGNGQNNQTLKTQNNEQPQGPAVVGGSNARLPTVPTGQKKQGQTQFGQGSTGQGQPQNLKTNTQNGGGGPAVQKVETKKPHDKGTIPLLKDKNGQPINN